MYFTKLKRYYLFIFLFLCLPLVSANIIINEIMYDPECYSDMYCEWIELYNDDSHSVNVSGWTFGDDDANDTLEGYDNTIISGFGYAIIVDDDTRIYNEFEINSSVVWLYTGDDTVGGSKLGNKETITIYDSFVNEINSVSYDNEVNNTGNTWALIDEGWKESEPTPGKSNDNEQDGLDYSKIEITEFLPNPEGDDDASMPDGEWIEIFNAGDQDLDLLGFRLVDNSGKEILIDNSHVGSSTIISSDNFMMVYVNGKYGFLNNDGFETLSLLDLNGEVLDKVSYSESNEGASWSKLSDEWRITPPTKGAKNSDEKTTKSILSIESIYDLGSNNVAEWGDTLRLKVNIFKGDSTKNVVYIEARKDNVKISKQTKLNVYEKFTNQTLTLPLQLDANCNNNIKEGRYDIIMTGLDAEPEIKEIEIRGNDVCDIKAEEKPKIFEYSLKEAPQIITINEPFQSSVVLRNNEGTDLNVQLWSYVYRGNKQYSGNETSNMISITLPSNADKEIPLDNIVKDADTGEYNFKIKILKEGRVTPYEIKKEILINKPDEKGKRENIINAITGAVVYESSQVKAKRAGIFFFAFTITLILVYQTWRKK